MAGSLTLFEMPPFFLIFALPRPVSTDTFYSNMKRNYQDDIQKFNLDSDVQRCSSLYDSKSFPDLLSVTRREMSHSAFLSELLKYESFHGLGNYPLLLFLQAVLHRADLQHTKIIDKHKPVIFSELRSGILSRTLNPSSISVQKEWNFKDTDGNSGRVDVLVRCKVNVQREGEKPVRALNIIIENKVFSAEHGDQTERYYKHFNALLGYKAEEKVGKKTAKLEAGGPMSRYNLYVYLTPLATKDLDKLSEPECECKECVQINYQDLVDGVIEPMLGHPSLSPRGRFILEEYLRGLSVSFEAVEENSQDSKGHIKVKKTGRQVILAVGKEEKAQLLGLWKNYHPLVKAAINEANNDSEEENDGSSGRVYYAYKGQPFSMGRLVEAIISDKLADYTFEQMNSLFKPVGIEILSKKKKSNYFPESAPSTKDTDPIEPYIFKSWSQGGNFEKFKNVVKEKWGIDIEPFKEEHLSPEDRVCLRDFYGAHDSLITTMLEVIKRYHEEEKVQDEAESLLKRCTRRRDRTTYSLTTLTDATTLSGLSWGRMIMAVVQDYANKGMTLAEIKKDFELSKDSMKEWDGKAEGNTGYFTEDGERITVNGETNEYVIKRGWSKERVEDFIDKANGKGYEISEEQ